MDSFKFFNAEKKDVISSLQELKKIVLKLDEVGIDVSDDIGKIENSIHDIEADALRIALVGAFSDGKTSVVAGWLGQVMPDMKINSDESSDRLAVYRPDNLPDKCEIVDTPGLFGDKERDVGEDKVIQYSEITKKYISEAHLIFYIVDATNPLKESHKETVNWLLRDLNKLTSTIFIINKMDEVADLRDTEDFNNQARIKRENLLEKLERFVNLSVSERQQVNIVCIASNPNDKGLDFWLEKKDVYEDRSRISTLKECTNSILDNTTRNFLIKKTGLDVIKSLISQKIKEAESEYAQVDIYLQHMTSEIKRIDEDIESGKKDIISAKKDLINELMDFEKRLLGKIRTLSQEDVLAFLEDEIGHTSDDTGYKLRLSIEQSCEQCFQQSSNIMKSISARIEGQLDSSEKFANSISSSALKVSTEALKKVSMLPVNTIKTGIFVARDTIASVTGIVYKFKPWEATKLAASISKWAGPVGAGIQVFTDIAGKVKQQRSEEQLIKLQTELKELVKDHFKSLYDILADNAKVFENFAPQIIVFEKVLEQQKEGLSELLKKKSLLNSIKEEFKKSYNSAEVIDAEFTVVS